jgi:dihydroflavonol-4-reductase
MSLSDWTVAVTGATGFLGSHIALHLREQGAQARAVVRNPKKGEWLAEHGIALAEADLSDPEAMRRAFEDADAVVSAAALATGDRAGWEAFRAANIAGSDNLMRACVEAGIGRVVHVSTIAVYKNRLFRQSDESAPLLGEPGARPGWSRLVTNPHYALSKAIGERRAWEWADEHGIALTVLRPGPVIGSRDHKLTARYARGLARWIQPVPTFRIPHVHAGDVALAVSGALRNPDSAGRAYNVTGPPRSPWEVLRAWKRRRGHGAWLVPIPVPVWIDYDDGAAARDLGFRNRSLDEALEEIMGAQ